MALGDTIEERSSKRRDRLIAVYIGILAVALAVSSVGSGNATKDAIAHNIQATDTWAFFQAKNIRRNDVRLQIDALQLRLASESGLLIPARTAIEEKIKSYREYEARLTSEPKTGEGLDELFVKAKALEAARDVAMRRDAYFDYGQALLQIAIVLASVSIITGGSYLLLLSAVLAAGGGASTLNGFMLAFSLPFIG